MKKPIAIIVSFNNFKTLKPLLTSLKTQGLKAIVIDNASTDGSVEFGTIRNKTNLGFSRAVNQGVKLALTQGCKQILLLNPDIKVKKGFLKPLSASLNQAGAGIAGPILKHAGGYDHGGWVNWFLGRTNHFNYSRISFKWPKQRQFVSGACMLIAAEVFKSIGYLDEQFWLYFEDVDLCLRAKKAGFKTLVVPQSLVNHQIGAKTKSRLWQHWQGNWRFIVKHQPLIYKPFGLVYLLALAVKIVLTRINDD